MCTQEEKPDCGSTDIKTDKSDFWGTILDILGAIAGAKLLFDLIKIGVEGTATTIAEVMQALVGASVGPWVIAIVAAAVATFIVWFNFTEKCVSAGGDRKFNQCFAGAVDEIHNEGLGFHAFAAEHPFLRLVVRCRFWPRLLNASFIDCNEHLDRSPRLVVVFKSDVVCNAALGGAIGGTVGAVGGAIGGAIAGAAIASLGCGPFAWLCAILAIIVILAAVALGTYLGATAGSHLGGLAGEEPIEEEEGISVGDLIKVFGPTTNNANFDGVLSQVFTDTEQLMMLGAMPSGLAAPFSWQDVNNQFFDMVPGETEPREIDDGCPSNL